MTEEPRTADTGPAPTLKTTETRTEKTEFVTSSDVQTSTSAKEEGARGQGAEATDDQRDRRVEDARDQGAEATDDQRDRRVEGARDQGEVARDDQRDPGDAPQGS